MSAPISDTPGVKKRKGTTTTDNATSGNATTTNATTAGETNGDVEEPPNKRLKFDFADCVELVVGKDNVTFHAPREALIRTSDFFKAALSGDKWKESIEKKILLPECDPVRLNTYLQWAVSFRLEPNDAPPGEENFQELVELWLLGEMLGDLRFRNRVLREFWICARSGKVLHPHTANFMWKSTQPRAKLRVLGLQTCAGPHASVHIDLYDRDLLNAMCGWYVTRTKGIETLKKDFKEHEEKESTKTPQGGSD